MSDREGTMNWTAKKHRALRALMLAVTAVALTAFAAPAAIAAEGERVLDLELSLTGGCKGDALDGVPDPSCPYPVAGPPTPPSFSNPKAVATDSYGNIYVSSFGTGESGAAGRIDIFCSDGTFISELVTPGPTSLAVDSEGNLYVYSNPSGASQLRHFAPDSPYQPETCDIEYSTAPFSLEDPESSNYSGIAINRDNDHLFANFGTQGVWEYNSAEEGNALLRKKAAPGPAWGGGAAMAVDAARNRMYASFGTSEERIGIYDLNTLVGTPPDDKYEEVGSILPSSVPAGDFGTQLSVAVNEGNGNVFLLDGENCKLYEFDQSGNYLVTINAPFVQCTFGGEIGVDNGPFSRNGKLSEEEEKGRYLYVPSHRSGTGHSFALFESIVSAAEVKSTAAANISEDEAELQAQIDPNNAETTYTFEFKSEGALGWTPAGGETLPAGSANALVSVAVNGLSPGTSYRFRVVATNEAGSDEAEGSFATYPSIDAEPSPCPNALLRTARSALLPDCRAYELVTPADTNARAPLGTGRLGGVFTTRQVSPAGDKVPFRVEGGALPGPGGTGSLVGDPYLATRTNAGWSTIYTGPADGQASQIVPGASSPDQEHSFWLAGDQGPAVLAPSTAYIRYPNGHSELLGQGSLGKIDSQALGQLISEGGGHIVFSTGASSSASTAVQLEPEAAPDETPAVYDRTPDGTTHVVSLKPGDAPFVAGENAIYQGASLDGKGIAFKVGNTLYLRYDNEQTFEIGNGVTFAGVAEGGRRVFYVEAGDLKAFDVAGEEEIVFANTNAAVVPVFVSADGSTAYFVSKTAIIGSGPNPEDENPKVGAQNLYRSVEGLPGQIDFVGTVTERDVEGGLGASGDIADGLGLWVSSIGPPIPGSLGYVPARSTPDGGVFLFKSRAALTAYDPEGHAQIYRYDAVAGELQCLSCNPTGAPAGSDATLQSERRENGVGLFSVLAWPENLRADGRRAFFESSEALVVGDSDGLQDVYEWEGQGVGSCTKPGGCIYLISSPQSLRNEYLWAVSRSGDDVFFLSSELLVGADADQTPSIYDARVGGGFAEAAKSDCEGEGCRPRLLPPPALSGAATSVRGPGDNAKPRCPKGKRQVKRAGKVRCAKRKSSRKQAKQKQRRQRAGAEKKGGRR
jgi:hypothetical protein